MTFIEIVGTEPQPWWPEGVVHVEGGGWRYTGHDWTRTLFIGACVEWLLAKDHTAMFAADAQGAMVTLNYPPTRGVFKYEGPDLLSALVAACRSVKP